MTQKRKRQLRGTNVTATVESQGDQDALAGIATKKLPSR